MIKPGFLHNGRRIFYMEPRGKDISFERWRITLYYAVNYAETHFLPTQEDYDSFTKKYADNCYENFEDFRNKLQEAL